MNRPTEVELAWLAGIVDGEGTIGICRSNSKLRDHPYLKPTFQIANTDLKILDKARSILTAITGQPHNLVVSNVKRPAAHKVGYRLAANTQTAMLLILPLLMPYLVGKRRQAEIVLDYCSRRRTRSGCHAKWYEFKDEDELAYQQSLQLNRRGEPVVSAEVIELRRSA